ncbi:hypothetical protein TVAG_241000, partial [Trichomonas vaginalis G3]
MTKKYTQTPMTIPITITATMTPIIIGKLPLPPLLSDGELDELELPEVPVDPVEPVEPVELVLSVLSSVGGGAVTVANSLLVYP